MSSSHGASRVISIRFPLQRQTEFTFTILTVTDIQIYRYTDMSSQLVNLNLGYGNKAIGDAIIGVKADMADHISSRKLESAFERTIYSYKKHWGGFKVDNMMFYVLNDFSDDEIESIAEKIQSEKERYISVNKLYVAVSKTNNKLKSLPKTYRIVLRMLRLAVRADMTPMFYD